MVKPRLVLAQCPRAPIYLVRDRLQALPRSPLPRHRWTTLRCDTNARSHGAVLTTATDRPLQNVIKAALGWPGAANMIRHAWPRLKRPGGRTACTRPSPTSSPEGLAY